MRCTRIVALSLLLAGCGDRSLAPQTCADLGIWKQLSPELDAECKGNTGCTKKAPQCGCHCSLCENESCLSGLCDDGCMPMPTCPNDRPVSGSSCTGSLDCDYALEPCPCGPSDLKWHCSCTKGAWSCARDYDCYRCVDGRRDAGPDARDATADAMKEDVLKKDVSPKLDVVPCTIPIYPKDCSQVWHFDCGFSASCTGNVVQATWHEHVFCGDGLEQIVNYSCSYACSGVCVGSSAWPQNGTDLVQQYCK
jgi:hypothetical protein